MNDTVARHNISLYHLGIANHDLALGDVDLQRATLGSFCADSALFPPRGNIEFSEAAIEGRPANA